MRICLTFALIVCAAAAASVSMADTVQKTAYGQQWSGLKHISLPSKKPLPPWDTEKLSQSAKNVWSAYTKYYDQFYRAAKIFEISFENNPKSKLFVEYVSQMNKLSKSPGWTLIATTQPFKVKSGRQLIEEQLNRLSAIAYELQLRHDPNNNGNTITFVTAHQSFVPIANTGVNNFSTAREASYRELNATGQNLSMSGARAELENSTRSGHYDSEKFSQAKRQKRMGISIMQHAWKIKEEAKKNGEDWAKDDFSSP